MACDLYLNKEYLIRNLSKRKKLEQNTKFSYSVYMYSCPLCSHTNVNGVLFFSTFRIICRQSLDNLHSVIERYVNALNICSEKV